MKTIIIVVKIECSPAPRNRIEVPSISSFDIDVNLSHEKRVCGYTIPDYIFVYRQQYVLAAGLSEHQSPF